MKVLPRILPVGSCLLLALSGAILLLTLVLHPNPWEMSRVTIQKAPGTLLSVISVRFAFLGFTLNTTLIGLLIGCVTLVMIVLLGASGMRRLLKKLLRRKGYLFASGLSLLIFLGTLIPTKTWGLPVVVYLVLGTVGMILFLTGVYPFVDVLTKWQRSRPLLVSVWKGMGRVIFHSKLTHFLIFLFLVEFLFTNLVSYFVFEHIPHMQDGINQLFHGMIFAKGKLAVPSHPYPEFFDFTHMINNGMWYSQYPPGHVFLMFLGVLLGAPWVINPLIGSFTVVLLCLLGRELYDETTGRLAGILGLLSPFILFMSSEFMNHCSALFFFTLFVLSFAKSLRLRKAFPAILTGVALGMLINIRPYTALALSAPFAGYSLILLLIDFRLHARWLLTMLFVTFLFVGILLTFNKLTNGSPFLFGYQVLHGQGHTVGFGRSGWGPDHNPVRGLVQGLNNLNGLNKYLFEWPVPALFFLVLLFSSLTSNKWDYLLLSCFAMLWAAYVFYFYHDWCLGPRFLYEAAGTVILLCARGILRLPQFLQEISDSGLSERRVYGMTALAVAVCLIIGWSGNMPALARTYSDSYWDVNADVLKTVKRAGISNAIVFTRSYYGCVLLGNSPTFDGDVIFARDLGEKNKRLMSEYPDRTYYITEGNTLRNYISIE